MEYLNSTPPPLHGGKRSGGGVEVKTSGGGVEKDFRNLYILIAMNFRNTISFSIPFELLFNSFEYYCFLLYCFLVHLNLFEAYFLQNFNRNLLNNDFTNNIKRLHKRVR
jgi:hypothetical protein